MVFKRFSWNIALRVALLVATALAGSWAVLTSYWLGLIGFFLLLWQAFALHRYVTRVNRKLAFFMESIRYSDFSVKFSADNRMGSSFGELNRQLNGIMDNFRKTRAEKEAQLNYIDTIVQQISVGLLAFGTSGKVELANPAIYRLLEAKKITHINDIEKIDPDLTELLWKIPSGQKKLYQLTENQQLSVMASAIRIQGKLLKLISIQNIHSELQQKELEAWQNLTKILRHEIMNSMTPIVSLIGTISEIVENDIVPMDNTESTKDLTEALQTIESRSKGIMNFVNAYRDYTTLPSPVFLEVDINKLLSSVHQLMGKELETDGLRFELATMAEKTSVIADPEQLNMVLINLIRNAADAVRDVKKPFIILKTHKEPSYVVITVSDNGPGIPKEALEKIFIPFYTTKRTGSGIGLALSQQIVQQHNGKLRVSSNGKETVFSIFLPH